MITDNLGIVDERLRLYGVADLRIAHGSAIPFQHTRARICIVPPKKNSGHNLGGSASLGDYSS